MGLNGLALCGLLAGRSPRQLAQRRDEPAPWNWWIYEWAPIREGLVGWIGLAFLCGLMGRAPPNAPQRRSEPSQAIQPIDFSLILICDWWKREQINKSNEEMRLKNSRTTNHSFSINSINCWNQKSNWLRVEEKKWNGLICFCFVFISLSAVRGAARRTRKQNQKRAGSPGQRPYCGINQTTPNQSPINFTN